MGNANSTGDDVTRVAVAEEIAVANSVTLEEMIREEMGRVGLDPRKWFHIERFWKHKFNGPNLVGRKGK